MMKSNVCDKYPRILVISNNSFSDTTNNGKTLASFFKGFPAENISQLYFNSEIPNSSYYYNYFRITDKEVIKSIFNKKNKCGKVITYKVLKKIRSVQESKSCWINIVKKYNICRIAREIFWKSEKWKTEVLDQWLNEFFPEIVFLCAGDSGFAYDITKYIQKKYDTKLVVYVTDDYVLQRRTLSLFWWVRRNYILNKIREIVIKADLFITISKKMKEEYNLLLGKNSIIAVNMTESIKDESISVENKKALILVYTGGLHHKRYVTLNLLAKSLKRYNEEVNGNKKVYLKIYSEQEPSKKMFKCLNIEGASKFCNKLNSRELKKVLNVCDIPVHVEAFDRRSIEETRLSISTKIPEYLSLGKPVLAIGPKQIASMEYLKNCAFCITKKNNIYSDLKKLFYNRELSEKLSLKALQRYEKNHKREIVMNQFVQDILSIYK